MQTEDKANEATGPTGKPERFSSTNFYLGDTEAKARRLEAIDALVERFHLRGRSSLLTAIADGDLIVKRAIEEIAPVDEVTVILRVSSEGIKHIGTEIGEPRAADEHTATHTANTTSKNGSAGT